MKIFISNVNLLIFKYKKNLKYDKSLEKIYEACLFCKFIPITVVSLLRMCAYYLDIFYCIIIRLKKYQLL